MKSSEEYLYNIDKYSDEDLYNMLDMNNPSDRELEAKIVTMINKYEEMEGNNAEKLKQFFEDMHERFFDEGEKVIELEDEDYTEGFENMDKVSTPDEEKVKLSDYKNVFGKNE